MFMHSYHLYRDKLCGTCGLFRQFGRYRQFQFAFNGSAR